MTNNELVMLQALPLEIKIMKTEQRIKEWVNHWGLDGVYVSYSGGKDSEVLVDICRKLYPNIKIIFINTGVELPGTVKQMLKRKKQGYNIEVVIPKKRFIDIIKEYGYPVVSKEQSQYIHQYRVARSEKTKETRINGNKYGRGKISDKWKYLIDSDFKISDRCCYWLKKEPIARIEREREIKCIVGTMAEESAQRKSTYLQNGCNSFESKRPISKPLGFWLEDDIWEYIKIKNLEISDEYTKNGRCRTGCAGCLYGANLEFSKNGSHNILRLEKDYPKLYKFYIEKLNYKHVLKTLGLPWYNKTQQKLFEEEK